MTSFKLFLFDLDGTLVSTGGAGLRALATTFHELYDVQGIREKINPAGKTDPAIFREIIKVFFDRNTSPEEMKQVGDCYLRHLEQEMKSATTRALDGVKEFVKRAAGRPDVVVGLGTGNLERGARLKLEPTKLNALFEFGGFGSDAEDRSEVLKFGHRRAQEKIQMSISPSSVFVIGDTPLDVSAARHAGFQSVAVASGGVSFDELRATSPDFMMRDMTHGDVFFDQLEKWFPGASR